MDRKKFLELRYAQMSVRKEDDEYLFQPPQAANRLPMTINASSDSREQAGKEFHLEVDFCQ